MVGFLLCGVEELWDKTTLFCRSSLAKAKMQSFLFKMTRQGGEKSVGGKKKRFRGVRILARKPYRHTPYRLALFSNFLIFYSKLAITARELKSCSPTNFWKVTLQPLGAWLVGGLLSSPAVDAWLCRPNLHLRGLHYEISLGRIMPKYFIVALKFFKCIIT